MQTRSTVQRHLAAAKRELSIVRIRGELAVGCAVELRLKIAHLESALRHWIDGVSEYKRII